MLPIFTELLSEFPSNIQYSYEQKDDIDTLTIHGQSRDYIYQTDGNHFYVSVYTSGGLTYGNSLDDAIQRDLEFYNEAYNEQLAHNRSVWDWNQP